MRESIHGSDTDKLIEVNGTKTTVSSPQRSAGVGSSSKIKFEDKGSFVQKRKEKALKVSKQQQLLEEQRLHEHEDELEEALDTLQSSNISSRMSFAMTEALQMHSSASDSTLESILETMLEEQAWEERKDKQRKLEAARTVEVPSGFIASQRERNPTMPDMPGYYNPMGDVMRPVADVTKKMVDAMRDGIQKSKLKNENKHSNLKRKSESETNSPTRPKINKI